MSNTNSNGSAAVQLDELRQRLVGLGLAHDAEALADELSEAVQHDRAGHVVLDRLLTCEVDARDERRVRTSLKLSNLPPGMTLGNFDFAFQPSIERRQIEALATCAFIQEHATLLVQGPPGVGKTHLVVTLGVRAIEQGFSCVFDRLEDLRGGRSRLRADEHHRRHPVLPAGQLSLPPGQHGDNDEQERQGLAGDPGRGRGDDGGDPGPAVAQERGAERARQELPAGRDPWFAK